MKLENSVQFIRLVTGEDLVSEVTEVENNNEVYYVLNNPMKVMYMTGSKPGILSISLMQWVFWKITDEQEFHLLPKDILTFANASASMEDYYWSSLEHFEQYKEKTEMKEPVIEDVEVDDLKESLDELLNMIQGSLDKRKLH